MPISVLMAGRGRHKVPSQSAYDKLQQETLADLHSLAQKLYDGRIDHREWYTRFSNILLDRHADAWVLGRRRAGDSSPVGIEDELVGRAKADAESEWLLPFLVKIEEGGYLDDEGKLMLGKLQWRSGLYAGKLRGTANEAFVESSNDADEFVWTLGNVAEKHCSDCPTLAGMSPWRKDVLGTWPGSGGQPCLTNCKCSLHRESDGASGFGPSS